MPEAIQQGTWLKDPKVVFHASLKRCHPKVPTAPIGLTPEAMIGARDCELILPRQGACLILLSRSTLGKLRAFLKTTDVLSKRPSALAWHIKLSSKLVANYIFPHLISDCRLDELGP